LPSRRLYQGRQAFRTLIGKGQTVGSSCLFSIRHEFPSDWAKFPSITIDGKTITTSKLSLALTPELYPFWAQSVASSSPIKVKAEDLPFFQSTYAEHKELAALFCNGRNYSS